MGEILTFFKGLFIGVFYAFMPIYSMILIAYIVNKQNCQNGIRCSFGIIVMQIIWVAIAYALFFLAAYGLQSQRPILTLIGSSILFFLAARTYRYQERLEIDHDTYQTFWSIFRIGFLSSLSNPIRILGYFALFAILEVENTPFTPRTIFSFFLGILLGLFIFWASFSLFMHFQKEDLSPKSLQYLHKVSAFALVIFSAIGLFQIYL